MKLSKVTYEKCVWDSHIKLAYLNSRERRLVHTKYLAAVLGSIADVDIKVDSTLNELFINTAEQLARFDALIQEKSIVMPAILLRSESASSSQIERLTASTKNIGVASLGGKTKDNAQMVADNIQAMKVALTQTGEITNKSILNIHKVLTQRHLQDEAGKFRKHQVWIGSSGNIPHTANYVAPHHCRIGAYIADLVQFMNRKDIHPLLLAAVAHAQFETIHPFIDGNGRTGRALIQTILRNGYIITSSTLPLSAGLLSNVQDYYLALENFRDGNYNHIFKRLLISCADAVYLSWETLHEIENLRKVWNMKIKVRSDSILPKVLNLLFENPVIDAKFISTNLSVTDTASRRSIDTLLKAGIIMPIKESRRNVMYWASEVGNIMDNFGRSIQFRRH